MGRIDPFDRPVFQMPRRIHPRQDRESIEMVIRSVSFLFLNWRCLLLSLSFSLDYVMQRTRLHEVTVPAQYLTLCFRKACTADSSNMMQIIKLHRNVSWKSSTRSNAIRQSKEFTRIFTIYRSWDTEWKREQLWTTKDSRRVVLKKWPAQLRFLERGLLYKEQIWYR